METYKKKALVVGLENYPGQPLRGPLHDVQRMKTLLSNAGFEVRMLPDTNNDGLVTREDLRREIRNLFEGEMPITTALFFFAGHGYISESEGYLVTEKSTSDDPGVYMFEVLKLANNSKINSKFILLDCCHSGAFGNIGGHDSELIDLGSDVTLVAACRGNQSSSCSGADGGQFTSRVLNGLEGAAADDLGRINAASLYTYLNDGVSAWTTQNPVYKANVSNAEPIVQVERDAVLEYRAARFARLLTNEVEKSCTHQQRNTLLKTIDNILPTIYQHRHKLVDWELGSIDWIDEFYESILDYESIRSTDLESRSSIGLPIFERYLRKQYDVRLESIFAHQEDVPNLKLKVSREVAAAINRVGWEPCPKIWDTDIQGEQDGIGPEMVRILIRETNNEELSPDECSALWVLDNDHRLYGIPLFVVCPNDVTGATDFAIGLSSGQQVIRCYEFVEDKCHVELRNRERSLFLKKDFMKLLNSPNLMCVQEYIGNVMLKDPGDSRKYFGCYNNYRQSSSTIVNKITEYISDGDGLVGVDLGCGTGNYIKPFLDKFKKIIGIDINKCAIDEARTTLKDHADSIELRCADVLRIADHVKEADVIWCVSMLHYLKGDRQKELFKRLYKVLKPGGRVILDVGEFAEQHPSLWVVEYFPSLRDRYKNALHSREVYEQWLTDAKFTNIRCEYLDYLPDEPDKILRSGQHKPELYLEEQFQRSIPAFREMTITELLNGVRRLEKDIETGDIENIIDDYKNQATLPGDVGFIIADKA